MTFKSLCRVVREVVDVEGTRLYKYTKYYPDSTKRVFYREYKMVGEVARQQHREIQSLIKRFNTEAKAQYISDLRAFLGADKLDA